MQTLYEVEKEGKKKQIRYFLIQIACNVNNNNIAVALGDRKSVTVAGG